MPLFVENITLTISVFLSAAPIGESIRTEKIIINKIKNMLETENMEGTPEQIKTCAEKLVSKDSIMYPYILESFNAR